MTRLSKCAWLGLWITVLTLLIRFAFTGHVFDDMSSGPWLFPFLLSLSIVVIRDMRKGRPLKYSDLIIGEIYRADLRVAFEKGNEIDDYVLIEGRWYLIPKNILKSLESGDKFVLRGEFEDKREADAKNCIVTLLVEDEDGC